VDVIRGGKLLLQACEPACKRARTRIRDPPFFLRFVLLFLSSLPPPPSLSLPLSLSERSLCKLAAQRV